MRLALGFLGLPSLHSIIEGIAKGFFGALAHALVPSWLTHGTVATIQHLVALPDPASWTDVGELQSDMVFLAAMLLPVTLSVSTIRYWLVGVTGAAHPAGAIGRCVWVTFVLVAYRWFVEQTVAATNTLTHAVLGFPVVASGLQRIVGVLFGGALLSGAGGVFGAFLVIIGVLFAAALFAAQVLLMVLLAVMIVAGPPLIALSAIPELSHLARTWAHALAAITMVPLGWTVLFATAGALCLDATSFTGGAGGVPGHVAAAFAGLITFAIAVKLPLMLLGELRHLFGSVSGAARAGGSSAPPLPGAERVRVAHARLRSVALEGVPSLGRSVGRAVGAMGAPAGGPLGAARRTITAASFRNRGPLTAAAGGVAAETAVRATAGPRRGVRRRLQDARAILVRAPRDARAAVAASRVTPGRVPRPTGPGRGAAASRTTSARTSSAGGPGARTATRAPKAQPQRASAPPRASTPVRTPGVRGGAAVEGPARGEQPSRRVSGDAARAAERAVRSPAASSPPRPKPPEPAAPRQAGRDAQPPARRAEPGPPARKPRPGSSS